MVTHRHSTSPSLTSALDGVVGQRHAPAALPPRKTQYSLCRRLGGPQGRSGRVRKISPSPGFDPRTVQPVASHYTDCVIQPHGKSNGIIIFKFAEILKKAVVFGNSSNRRASVLGDTKMISNQMRNGSANNFSEKFQCIISTGCGWHFWAAALDGKLFSRISMIS